MERDLKHEIIKVLYQIQSELEQQNKTAAETQKLLHEIWVSITLDPESGADPAGDGD